MKQDKLTLADIEQWVNNDEGLYLWWKASRKNLREFCRYYRDELTTAINQKLG